MGMEPLKRKDSEPQQFSTLWRVPVPRKWAVEHDLVWQPQKKNQQVNWMEASGWKSIQEPAKFLVLFLGGQNQHGKIVSKIFYISSNELERVYAMFGTFFHDFLKKVKNTFVQTKKHLVFFLQNLELSFFSYMKLLREVFSRHLLQKTEFGKLDWGSKKGGSCLRTPREKCIETRREKSCILKETFLRPDTTGLFYSCQLLLKVLGWWSQNELNSSSWSS